MPRLTMYCGFTTAARPGGAGLRLSLPPKCIIVSVASLVVEYQTAVFNGVIKKILDIGHL